MDSLSIVLGLISGLAMFLFGMTVMGDALEKAAGNKLKVILGKMTSNPFSGFLLGTAVTAIIQSSSATTVMLVGFVNAGLMSLGAAIPVIMGANIGTTVTAWILSLTGITGSGFIEIFKPSTFAPVLAAVGVVLFVFMKGAKKKDIGLIFLGFSILIFGMETMSGSIEPLAEQQWFRELFIMFKNPILGLAVGAIVTAIIQSSSASVGILQALAASTGTLTVGMTIPILMGQHIGTCITAVLGSVGAHKDAKRVAAVHLSFNIIGSVVVLSVYSLFQYLILPNGFAFSSIVANQTTIAICHTAISIIFVILLFPCRKLLEKLAYILVKGDNKQDKKILTDDRLLSTPVVAIEQAKILTGRMAEISSRSLKNAIGLFENYDKKVFASVKADEDDADIYEDELGTYLVKITGCEISNEESLEVSKLLHMIGDLERLSDHAVNLAASAAEMAEKKITFSNEATAELRIMINAVNEILDTALTAYTNNDLQTAYMVEPLEEVIDDLQAQIRNNHIERLTNNECTIELGFVLSDVLTNLERISDHCSNIAGCVIEISNHSLGMHEYTKQVKNGNEEFEEHYKVFSEKYKIHS